MNNEFESAYSNYKPLVTVYIPTFNRIELLSRAVDSVRNQTYQNLEIIVVDDCSTDNTSEYLKSISKIDSRIKFYLKEVNSGACVSRNIAIENAKGNFITGLDDDDYFHSNRIEVFIKFALKDEDSVLFTNYIIKKSSTQSIKPTFLTLLKRKKISHPDLLLRKNFIGNQIFVKTKYLKLSGGFDSNLKAWQDLECWYNLLKTQNLEAKFISKPTQTVDISHEHERLSTKKTCNIVHSYHYFINKHNLSYYKKLILENQLVRYMPDKYKIQKKLSLFILTRNKYLLKNLFK